MPSGNNILFRRLPSEFIKLKAHDFNFEMMNWTEFWDCGDLLFNNATDNIANMIYNRCTSFHLTQL